ncbi:hypothetical protein BDM02DRAFT_2423009 [Thelephora ganbajun]|uniref:Uncharacterized protein n=1 Tax=Thelephora ganbajun TaxID=370292 RepID=A0ACB6ZU69_THEGA|nr:hypothetical protein BDM02DRAFT_2423009 [Thelephora ganbajun]
MDVDIESLVHLEQSYAVTRRSLLSLMLRSRFYDEGYKDGFAHGRIHGLIEGRALGRTKGYEMFEELGFYEGFSLTWKKIYESTGGSEDRAIHNIRVLLDTIARFPRTNPSSSRTSLESDPSAEVDIPKLFRQIRARYKALCAMLGVRPSLRATGSDFQEDADGGESMQLDSGSKPKKVWEVDSVGKRTAGPQQLSF